MQNGIRFHPERRMETSNYYWTRNWQELISVINTRMSDISHKIIFQNGNKSIGTLLTRLDGIKYYVAKNFYWKHCFELSSSCKLLIINYNLFDEIMNALHNFITNSLLSLYSFEYFSIRRNPYLLSMLQLRKRLITLRHFHQ